MPEKTTPGLIALRQHPDADEGARAWAMGVPYAEGQSFEGEARTRWEWGWRDAEAGYRAQFKGSGESIGDER